MFLHLYQCICMFMQNYPLYWSSYRFSCLPCYPGILPLIINDQSFYRKCLKNVWMKIKSSWVTIHKWIWQCRNSLRRQTLRCVFRPIVKAGPPIHANSCQGKPPCETFTTVPVTTQTIFVTWKITDFKLRTFGFVYLGQGFDFIDGRRLASH